MCVLPKEKKEEDTHRLKPKLKVSFDQNFLFVDGSMRKKKFVDSNIWTVFVCLFLETYIWLH